MFLHVEFPAGDKDEKPVGVGLVPLMLPVEATLDAGAGVAAAAELELDPVVEIAGAGVSAGEEELGRAASGVKVVVAVGTPFASTSTEMMSEAVTWTVTSATAASCRGNILRTSRLCMRPISGGSPPSFCRLDGYTIAG
jgi:hypothetical protein